MINRPSNIWRRWIIKVGSSLVTKDGLYLNLEMISAWAAQISDLIKDGKQITLVTSGAIADGISKLGWESRPQNLHELQAAAAVGQMGLMEMYHKAFSKHHIRTAQVLLTHEDFANHRRYLNARTTLDTLLKLEVVPIINENDTVSTQEIQLGDNDTLAASVANLVDANVLLILTDQKGLFDRDPNLHPDAKLIEHIQHNDPALNRAAGPSINQLGRGGMLTKVEAARRAATSGASTIIASGSESDVIQRIASGEAIGTYIETDAEPQALRKRWIMNLNSSGELIIDDGAVQALKTNGKSLLPIGVVAVAGDFKKGDMVICKDVNEQLVACGLSNYSEEEAQTIIGKSGEDIKILIGEAYEPELIHRDNLAIIH